MFQAPPQLQPKFLFRPLSGDVMQKCVHNKLYSHHLLWGFMIYECKFLDWHFVYNT